MRLEILKIINENNIQNDVLFLYSMLAVKEILKSDSPIGELLKANAKNILEIVNDITPISVNDMMLYMDDFIELENNGLKYNYNSTDSNLSRFGFSNRVVVSIFESLKLDVAVSNKFMRLLTTYLKQSL